MNCQEGHNIISKSKPIKTGGYGYCLICGQYRKLVPTTVEDQNILIDKRSRVLVNSDRLDMPDSV